MALPGGRVLTWGMRCYGPTWRSSTHMGHEVLWPYLEVECVNDERVELHQEGLHVSTRRVNRIRPRRSGDMASSRTGRKARFRRRLQGRECGGGGPLPCRQQCTTCQSRGRRPCHTAAICDTTPMAAARVAASSRASAARHPSRLGVPGSPEDGWRLGARIVMGRERPTGEVEERLEEVRLTHADPPARCRNGRQPAALPPDSVRIG